MQICFLVSIHETKIKMKQVHWSPGIWKSKIQSRISCLPKKYYITNRIKVLQIIGSHDLKDQAHFGLQPPRNYWHNFQLFQICIAMQNSLFIPSIHSWDEANFRVPWHYLHISHLHMHKQDIVNKFVGKKMQSSRQDYFWISKKYKWNVIKVKEISIL